MGHVHLNVADIPAQRRFWIKRFDCRPLVRQVWKAWASPLWMILFTRQASEGTVLDHFGFKVRSGREWLP